MPKVSRSREIAAERSRVWALVSDPHNLPRWWPRATRVEDVRDSGTGARWTTVLGTARGDPVRADHHCTADTEGLHYGWEIELAGTPFERNWRAIRFEIELAGDGATTTVTLTSDEALRGRSRLGSSMIGAASRRRLDEALSGIERELTGAGDG